MLDKSAAMAALIKKMESQVGKLPLAEKPTDIVPGEGSLNAEIFFIGEAPGYHGSVQRRPFVGRSGELLRQTIREIGYTEAEVYIANIVKVRPPENRDPTPAEILAFRPFLDEEINIVQPKLIVTLGRFSMYKFLPDVLISQVHGRLQKVVWHDQPTYVLPMYHPAAALRNSNTKKAFVADFQKITKILEWITEQKGQ